MKGAGTDEEYIVRAIQAFSNPRKIKVLNSAYNQVLRRYRDTKDGDLAQWLKDDGMDEESDIVRDLLKR
jgi:cytochrome c553